MLLQGRASIQRRSLLMLVLDVSRMSERNNSEERMDTHFRVGFRLLQ